MNDEIGTKLRHDMGLLTEDEVAAIARVKPRTEKSWRANRDGPPYIAWGRAPLYRRESLLAWLTEREIQPARTRAP